MDKDEAISIIRRNRPLLSDFHVEAIYLFGSVVRGEAVSGSDIDILIEFEPNAHIGLFGFARLQQRLSEILGAPVDLATPASLHKALKERILKEAVRAA